MGRQPFRFKQFAMCDEHCGMRIGTDGVLLGAWADVAPQTIRVADIGTGCGIIALMIAQRAPHARITAVEYEPGACSDARKNFNMSPWPDRFTLEECCFSDFTPHDAFDLIVSNPPFFTESLQSPDTCRAVARHAGSLSFESIAARCAELLSPRGSLAVILPTADDDATIMTAALHKLYPQRLCHVRNSCESIAKRSLWEFSRKDGECKCDTLTLHDPDGTFSDAYRILTRDFHINF